MKVSLKAEAVSSRTTCCNQDVTVPESGHSVVVTRFLKIKVGVEKMFVIFIQMFKYICRTIKKQLINVVAEVVVAH